MDTKLDMFWELINCGWAPKPPQVIYLGFQCPNKVGDPRPLCFVSIVTVLMFKASEQSMLNDWFAGWDVLRSLGCALEEDYGSLVHCFPTDEMCDLLCQAHLPGYVAMTEAKSTETTH